jgi:hypothetical protein
MWLHSARKVEGEMMSRTSQPSRNGMFLLSEWYSVKSIIVEENLSRQNK